MEPFLGEIRLFSFNVFVPRGWMACAGQALSLAENPALFSLVGLTYGGDGKTTFMLPDLRGKQPQPGSQYCIAIGGVYPTRD